MGLFSKRTQVMGPETILVGKFDPTVDGCYRNVEIRTLQVKPKHSLYVKVTSDNPVDVVVANEDQSAAGVKNGITEVTMGPFSTQKFSTMGLFLGVYRGDKANVTVEAWMEKA
jgi:hypothetical protein